MKALFIGRFQPFHIGHLKVILEASKKYKKIIIGIGSSQYCNTIDNPFTYEERKLMIDESLKHIKSCGFLLYNQLIEVFCENKELLALVMHNQTVEISRQTHPLKVLPFLHLQNET